MPDYQLYGLGRSHIEAVEWIEAKTDNKAIAFARSKKLPVRGERWDRDRLVARIGLHDIWAGSHKR